MTHSGRCCCRIGILADIVNGEAWKMEKTGEKKIMLVRTKTSAFYVDTLWLKNENNARPASQETKRQSKKR